MISFNDRAIARTIGSNDPDDIRNFTNLINDVETPVMLTRVDVIGDEPTYVVGSPQQEIDRLLKLHRRQAP